MIETIRPSLWLPTYQPLYVVRRITPPTIALNGSEWDLFGDEMRNPTLDERLAGWFCYAFVAVKAETRVRSASDLKKFWKAAGKCTIISLGEALRPTGARVVVACLDLRRQDIHEPLKRHWEVRLSRTKRRLGKAAPRVPNLIWMDSIAAALMEIAIPDLDHEVMEKISIWYDDKTLKPRERAILHQAFTQQLDVDMRTYLGRVRAFALQRGHDLFQKYPAVISVRSLGSGSNPFMKAADFIVREVHAQLQLNNKTVLPAWVECRDSTDQLKALLGDDGSNN